MADVIFWVNCLVKYSPVVVSVCIESVYCFVEKSVKQADIVKNEARHTGA